MSHASVTVTIPTEHLPELRRWVETHQGACQQCAVIIGRQGQIMDQPTERLTLDLAAFHLAAAQPDLRLPAWTSLTQRQRHQLLAVAADSWTYLNEGYFEDEDIPDLVAVARPMAIEDGNLPPEEPTGIIDHLRRQHLPETPDWVNLEPVDKFTRWQRPTAHRGISSTFHQPTIQ